MKVKILSKEHNPLLKKRGVTFRVEHTDKGGTPPRLEVRRQLATLLKTDLELVYVKKMETKTGTTIAFGRANAYDSVEQARLVEPKHIVARNAPPKPPEASQAPEKPKEPEASQAPEKPKEPEASQAPEKPKEPEASQAPEKPKEPEEKKEER